jgi:hypothetical protein
MFARHEAALVFNALADVALAEFESLDLKLSWKRLPAAQRKRISELFKTNRKFNEADPFAEFAGGGSLPYVYNLNANSDTEPNYCPEGHTLIAVPNQIRDTQHRQAILGWLDTRLPRPLFRDLRWLKPNGRALGTKAEWTSFLLVEEWTSEAGGGFGIGMAANFAALEIYANFSFGAAPEQRRDAGSEFRATDHKIHPHASTVEKRFRAIEAIIAGVYPAFAPLKPG